jgi:hypothetical protein
LHHALVNADSRTDISPHISQLPAFAFNQEDAQLWEDNDEVGVSIIDQRLIINDNIVWQSLKDGEKSLLALGSFAREGS